MCERPRLFLPIETLDRLVCSECKEYLRCGPIKVKLDGESVCGKCSSSPKHAAPLIHHKAFEDVVSLVWFPCKYRKYGCAEYISFDDSTNHEDSCVFRTYYCPVDFLSCTWNGTASQLPQHYRRDHQDLFMPIATFELDLDETTQETKLYIQEHFCFLVLLKVSKEEGKLWIKIEHLGEVNGPTSITYKLILHTTEEDGLKMVTKERIVSQASSCTVFDASDSQSVDINSLLTILEHPPNVFCTVDIKIPLDIIKEAQSKLDEIKCPHCSCFMAPPIFICSEGHSSCQDCLGYNKKCKACNKNDVTFSRNTALEVISAGVQLPCRWPSCKDLFDYSTVRDHEKTCQHKKYKCPRCYKWNGTYKKLCDHFAKEHDTHPLHVTQAVTIRSQTKVYDFYILAFGDIFGCSLFPTEENGKNFSLWYYGLPTFYDKYEYYVHLKKNVDEEESTDIKIYKLEKCCATENCFSFNLKIPNEDLDKIGNTDCLYFVFEIVELS